MTDEPRRRLRCAVYTRKSTEDGLEQDFNSLDAQREACTAYVASQRHEGWEAVPDFYDDGGFSGGTMERPGLKQLLTEIEAGRVDIIVVYKVDRLTRMFAMNRRERVEGKRSKHPSLLTGLLTDPHGRSMGPVSTAKGSRRYRYYISRTEPGIDKGEVARVAAGPIEQLVLSIIDRHLCRSVSAADLVGPQAPPNPPVLPSIGQRRKLLEVGARVQVCRDRVTVTLSGYPAEDGAEIQLEEPAQLISAGPEIKRAIAPDERSSQANLDPALLRLVAHAFAARRKMVEVKVEPTVDAYSDEHLAKLVRLSWLAPDIINSILDGHQPASLNGRRLLRTSDLPLSWSAQRRALGFA